MGRASRRADDRFVVESESPSEVDRSGEHAIPLRITFETMRQATRNEPPPTYGERMERLARLARDARGRGGERRRRACRQRSISHGLDRTML